MLLSKELLAQSPPDILQCGLHPTFDQIEMYAYHLPQASLANLVDIFTSLSVIDDSLYSLCQLEDFKFLADMIEHIKLPLKAKYTFCCAPINRKMPLVCTMFMKIVRQYSRGELVTFDWLCHQLGWPFRWASFYFRWKTSILVSKYLPNSDCVFILQPTRYDIRPDSLRSRPWRIRPVFVVVL